MKIKIIVFITALTAIAVLTGCGKDSSLLDSKFTTAVRSAMSDIGLFDINRGTSSTFIGLQNPNMYGVGTSTVTINTPVSVNVLEKHDSPFVTVGEISLFKSENIPANTRIKKTKQYYNSEGKIIQSDVEIYEPVQPQQKKNPDPAWTKYAKTLIAGHIISFAIGIVGIVWWVVIVIGYMIRKIRVRLNKTK